MTAMQEVPPVRIAGDVKCYHCGHISGRVEGIRAKRIVIDTFTPRPGFKGALPQTGERLRCERCAGPTYLEDVRPIPTDQEALFVPKGVAAKRTRASRHRAA
jgi:hypothetical protein